MQTRSEQARTTFVSSSTTMSTHFSAGDFNSSICFFTIASNAMSGVNKPVLGTTLHHFTVHNKQANSITAVLSTSCGMQHCLGCQIKVY